MVSPAVLIERLLRIEALLELHDGDHAAWNGPDCMCSLCKARDELRLLVTQLGDAERRAAA